MKRIFWATIICAVILSMTAPLVFAERESFFRLRDVPQSYVGEAGKTLVVKSTEDGLEYTTSPDYTTIDLTALNSTDGTDTTIIKHVQEPGLGGRLTFGLDETARTMVICDAGDVDTDLGLSIVSNPTLQFLKSDGSVGTSINYNDIFVGVGGYLYISGGATPTFRTYKQVRFHPQADLTASNYFTINSEAGIELTDTDSEQSWLYIEPKINQSGTAGYNGLKIKVTETALGDGSTGTGATNNLIVAGTEADTDMFKVDNSGNVTTAGAVTDVHYETIYIPAASMSPTSTSGAVLGSYEYATNDIQADYLGFNGATEQYATFMMPFPAGWDRSTVKIKFYWSSATGSTANDTVEWEIAGGALSDDDAIDAALGTAQVVSDALLADNGADLQVSGATPALTVGGTPALGDMLVWKVSRNVGGTDDMTEDAWLMGALIQYKVTNAEAAW